MLFTIVRLGILQPGRWLTPPRLSRTFQVRWFSYTPFITDTQRRLVPAKPLGVGPSAEDEHLWVERLRQRAFRGGPATVQALRDKTTVDTWWMSHECQRHKRQICILTLLGCLNLRCP